MEPAVSLSCYEHPTAGLHSKSFASTSRSIRPSKAWDLLGASEKQFRKSTSILVMSFRPHETARLQPDGFFLKFHILGIYKICWHIPITSSKDQTPYMTTDLFLWYIAMIGLNSGDILCFLWGSIWSGRKADDLNLAVQHCTRFVYKIRLLAFNEISIMTDFIRQAKIRRKLIPVVWGA